MSKINCCYKCEKRYLGCHADCEEYKKEKEELTRIREIEKRERLKLVEMTDYDVKRHEKVRKSKRLK